MYAKLKKTVLQQINNLLALFNKSAS